MKIDLEAGLDKIPDDIWEELAKMHEEQAKIHTLIREQDKRLHNIETKDHE